MERNVICREHVSYKSAGHYSKKNKNVGNMSPTKVYDNMDRNMKCRKYSQSAGEKFRQMYRMCRKISYTLNKLKIVSAGNFLL